MSRRRVRRQDAATPQHVTVKTVGPLDPWRLPAVVIGVALTTGGPLLDATRTGHRLDGTLLRAFVIGFAMWMLLGFVNKLLAQASVRSAVERTRLELAGHQPTVDAEHRPTTPGDPAR